MISVQFDGLLASKMPQSASGNATRLPQNLLSEAKTPDQTVSTNDPKNRVPIQNKNGF